MITMSTEKSPTGLGLLASSGNGLSYHDAISTFFIILLNLYVIPERIIFDYKAMNWEPVNYLILIREFIGIMIPLVVCASINKRWNTLITLCIICSILIGLMYMNLVEVVKLAQSIGETNVSAFYWSYFEYLGIIILVSLAVQGTIHLLENKKQWSS